MSLNGITASALSALQTSQAALNVVSNNVSNINTQGYARRVVNQTTQVAGGGLTGVDIADIQRITDQFLQSETLSAGAGSACSSIAIACGIVMFLLGMKWRSRGARTAIGSFD